MSNWCLICHRSCNGDYCEVHENHIPAEDFPDDFWELPEIPAKSPPPPVDDEIF